MEDTQRMPRDDEAETEVTCLPAASAQDGWSHQKLGERLGQVLWPPAVANPTNALTLDFWRSEPQEQIPLVSRSPVCGDLLPQP